MTKDEAIQALKEGKKVTHRYFMPGEYISSDPTGKLILFEDGLLDLMFWQNRKEDSWETDWKLYEPGL